MTSAPSPAESRTPLARLLRWMQGADLVEKHEEDGGAVTLWFREDNAYFSGEEVISRLVIGAAFALLYRGNYDALTFNFRFKGHAARVQLSKEQYRNFFKCTDDQMAQFASSAQRFEASPIAAVNEARQWEFFLEFSGDGR